MPQPKQRGVRKLASKIPKHMAYFAVEFGLQVLFAVCVAPILPGHIPTPLIAASSVTTLPPCPVSRGLANLIHMSAHVILTDRADLRTSSKTSANSQSCSASISLQAFSVFKRTLWRVSDSRSITSASLPKVSRRLLTLSTGPRRLAEGGRSNEGGSFRRPRWRRGGRG